MANKAKTIDVHFFRASMLEKGGTLSRPVDWSDQLAATGGKSLVDRTHDGDVYDVHVHDDMVLVGVHRVINTDFMTEIDASKERISDLMDEAAREGARRFAHTTVMAFLPRHNAVAVARGGANSPRALSAVANFLERHLRQGQGTHWAVEPIMTPDKVATLRKAKGVVAFEGRYETLRLIGDPEPGQAGLASHVDEYASAIGGELIVDVKVRIAPGYSNSQTAKAVRDLMLRDIPRLFGSGRKVKAKAVYDDDSTEVLDIVAGTLCSKMELGADSTEVRRYSALLAGLRNVSREMQDEVDRLVGG